MQTVHNFDSPISGSALVAKQSPARTDARGGDAFVAHFEVAGQKEKPATDDPGTDPSVDENARDYDLDNGASADELPPENSGSLNPRSEAEPEFTIGQNQSRQSVTEDEAPQQPLLGTRRMAPDIGVSHATAQSAKHAEQNGPGLAIAASNRSPAESGNVIPSRAGGANAAEGLARSEIPGLVDRFATMTAGRTPANESSGGQSNPAARSEILGNLPGSSGVGLAQDATVQQGSAKMGGPPGGAQAGSVAQQPALGGAATDSNALTAINTHLSDRFGIAANKDHPARVRTISGNSPTMAQGKVPGDNRNMLTDRIGLAQNGAVNAAFNPAVQDQNALASDIGSEKSLLTPLPETASQSGSIRSVEAMIARPETARMVATQMVNATIAAQNNNIEIALNPEELGRVRMVLSMSDTGVTVSITAERPEILDMMRRHIDQLAEEFRRMGYENIGFEFSGGNNRDSFDKEAAGSGPDNANEPENRRDTTEPDPIEIACAKQSRGLDLRL